jgi:UDP-N-acetylenolpyruvoylglucosamine reductase
MSLIDKYSRKLAGSLYLPGTKEFSDACKLFNGRVTKQPRAAVRCTNERDVLLAMELGSSIGSSISAKGGGHHVAGIALCEDGVVLDLSSMDQVSVDPARQEARVGGGCTYGSFDAATEAHGLATTGGAFSTTGIGGLVLGGGVGWLMGTYGLACDNLVGARIVDGTGTVREVSATSDSELLWLLRGGGAGSCVVLEFTFRLHPVVEVTAGSIFVDATIAPEVLERLFAMKEQIPDPLTLSPSLFFSKDRVPQCAIDLCIVGSDPRVSNVLEVLHSLRGVLRSTVTRMPYTRWQANFDNYERKGLRSYWKTACLPRLDREIAQTIVDCFCRAPDRRAIFFLEHIHGAAADTELISSSAFPWRSNSFMILMTANWESAADDDTNISWIKQSHALVSSSSPSIGYVNYFDDDDFDRRAFLDKEAQERRNQLFQRLDPAGIFYRRT